MNDDHAWEAANNIWTLINHDEGTGAWRESVIEILKMTWNLGYDEGYSEARMV